jgi:hypothetical protein
MEKNEYLQKDYFYKGPIHCVEFLNKNYLMASEGSNLLIYQTETYDPVYKLEIF